VSSKPTIAEVAASVLAAMVGRRPYDVGGCWTAHAYDVAEEWHREGIKRGHLEEERGWKPAGPTPDERDELIRQCLAGNSGERPHTCMDPKAGCLRRCLELEGVCEEQTPNSCEKAPESAQEPCGRCGGTGEVELRAKGVERRTAPCPGCAVAEDGLP
jgi:hypothetical protein